jgi:hypothetical protein
VSYRRKTISALALISLIASTVAVVVWWQSYHRFDSGVWKAIGLNEACTNNRRERMVGDLRSHHLRAGMTISEVTALLGPPAEIDRWPNKQLERQDSYFRSHSQQEFGLTRAEYDKVFPRNPLPQDGVTFSWITAGHSSDCSNIAIYFRKGRLAEINRQL